MGDLLNFRIQKGNATQIEVVLNGGRKGATVHEKDTLNSITKIDTKSDFVGGAVSRRTCQRTITNQRPALPVSTFSVVLMCFAPDASANIACNNT